LIVAIFTGSVFATSLFVAGATAVSLAGAVFAVIAFIGSVLATGFFAAGAGCNSFGAAVFATGAGTVSVFAATAFLVVAGVTGWSLIGAALVDAVAGSVFTGWLFAVDCSFASAGLAGGTVAGSIFTVCFFTGGEMAACSFTGVDDFVAGAVTNSTFATWLFSGADFADCSFTGLVFDADGVAASVFAI
jgi:hypothetical protein